MSIGNRLRRWRQSRAHRRYEEERARRAGLEGEDTEEVMRKLSRRASGWMGPRGHGP